MANWINLYPTSSDYTADQSARDALGGPTVSMIALDGQLHYDKGSPVDPYNPLGLPPFTIRCKFESGYTPNMGTSQTLVDAGENVWDITKNDTDWSELFVSNSDLIAVLGANTNGVTSMLATFISCSSLTTVQLFDTSSCTDMYMMFSGCSSLTAIPLFDTSNATTVEFMFQNCYNVQSGALALYQQAFTQANPPEMYNGCFEYCGENAPEDAPIKAEMQQIPFDWGGLAY